MPAVVSPRPRHARAQRPLDQPTVSLLSHTTQAPTPRLMSPIEIPSPRPSPSRSACRHRCKPYPTPLHHRRPTSFDHLPWISALDAPPADVRDIADLSQIPDPTPRKPTPRATPDLVPSTPLFLRSNTPRPSPCATPTPPSDTSRPHTPRPRFIPSRVLFHHLMPVLRDEPADPPCTFTITTPLHLR